MQKCQLCESAEAKQKNSHIIPSFLCARVLSYDGTGKRDKDVTFTITKDCQTTYVGKVPSTKYEELFTDTLTEERIEQLKQNPMTEDCYLCLQCEKKLLSDLLETPYAETMRTGKNIDGGLALFFWVSVFWRLSVTHNLGDWFVDDINEKLRFFLYSYLTA